ncbi:MAG: MJ0042-type zinc finger domain-containing protein [Alphaproteobacteria bacterium]
MILSCTACGTRYLIDPALLGPDGRVVRCAKCGHQWTQTPPEDLPRQVELPPLESDFRAIPGAARPPGTNLPALQSQPKRRGGVIAWMVLILIVAGLAAGVVLGRHEIVAAWPPAAKLYELAGFAGEELGNGLELRNVASASRSEDGVAVLAIEGEVANISSAARDVPTMRAIIKDGDREVRSWTFKAAQARLLPGESASFVTSLRDPPANATGLTITFTADK